MGKYIFVLAFLFVNIFWGSSMLSAKDNRPNILLILVDDMGYSDIAPFGGEIRTPTLDSLAKSGIRFTDFHTSVSCSPTRSMLLSGTDNHLAGLGNMSEVIAPNQVGKPGYEGHLNDRVVSIAMLLRDAGYATSMSGKWHLGEEVKDDPYHQGVEKADTMLQGGTSHCEDESRMDANYTPIYREDGVRTHVPEGILLKQNFTLTRSWNT